jgi:hypothetical protein
VEEPTALKKQEYLVVYDYGQGGIWSFILATSLDQIRERFPELRVITEKPTWMTPEREERIRNHRTLDIDEPNHGFLADIIRERDPPGSS